MRRMVATTLAPNRDEKQSDLRSALPVIVAVFVATRFLLVLVAVFLEFTIPLGYHGPTWSSTPILQSLTGSDSVFLLGIAKDGYHLAPIKGDYHDWVFFPLYPIVVRLASTLTLGDIAVAGVLVANAAFLGAMAALYRLAVPHLGHGVAVRSVAYLAIAPGAVAFAMAYSDSLFLLLAVGAFLAAERRRWGWMGLLYALASLTRLPGVLIGLPLLLVVISKSGRSPGRQWLWLTLGPVALLAFYGYLGWLTGDLLANLHAQSAWNSPPPTIASGDFSQRFDPLVFLLIGTLLLYTFLLVYFRPDRIPMPYALMAVVALLSVMASLRLLSVGRYLAVVWPFDWVLARRQAAWFTVAWPIASTGLFVIQAMLHFTQALAP